MERTQRMRAIEPWALSGALWAWLALSVLLAQYAWASGGRSGPAALILGLGAAPVLATFLVHPTGAGPWAGALAATVWTGFATAATVITGGAHSPMVVAFLIGPAMALRLGDQEHAAEAAVCAGAGFIAVALLGIDAPRTEQGFVAFAVLGALAMAVWILVAPAPEAAPLPPAPPSAASAIHAAAMAHELRTPLTHILGFSEMMQSQIFGPLAPKYLEYAGLIRSSGTHLLSLVNDLMDLSRIEAGAWRMERATFNAVLVCGEAAAQSEGQAGVKGVTLRFTPATPAIPVTADARALRQIVLNLVANAVKFTPKGGAVKVAVRVERGDLVIQVEDTGPGFPPTAFANLARPFERGAAGADTPGVGLGLALVKSLAGLHGGRLSLANADAGGALVTVRLPVLAG